MEALLESNDALLSFEFLLQCGVGLRPAMANATAGGANSNFLALPFAFIRHNRCLCNVLQARRRQRRMRGGLRHFIQHLLVIILASEFQRRFIRFGAGVADEHLPHAQGVKAKEEAKGPMQVRLAMIVIVQRLTLSNLDSCTSRFPSSSTWRLWKRLEECANNAAWSCTAFTHSG